MVGMRVADPQHVGNANSQHVLLEDGVNGVHPFSLIPPAAHWSCCRLVLQVLFVRTSNQPPSFRRAGGAVAGRLVHAGHCSALLAAATCSAREAVAARAGAGPGATSLAGLRGHAALGHTTERGGRVFRWGG